MYQQLLLLISLCFLYLIGCAQTATVVNSELQMATAVLAMPEEDRANATLLGYAADGTVVVMREGTNQMIGLADDPNKEGFNAAAYHEELEPFMTRGRALKAEGKTFEEIFDIREEEAKAGSLKMPEKPTTLYVLSGKEATYDQASGELTGANLRWVVYTPWATAESSGLPLKPQLPGGPWLMDPGTHRAHIMIFAPQQ
ncbi:MAG: hypothetical protein AAF399_21535 [Bacteroidota bacterium]